MLALNNMSQQLDEDLTNLLRYFGEDPSSTKPEDFFGIISSFAIAVQVRHVSRGIGGSALSCLCAESRR
jgi:hypothetical protein